MNLPDEPAEVTAWRLRKDFEQIKRNAAIPLPACCRDIVCRGCKALGTACGKCSRCKEDAPQ